MPTTLFQSAAGRAQLTTALTNMLPHAAPYIVVGTPAAYKDSFAGGQTSVNAAWYSSLWHLSMHEDWAFDATLKEKVGNYTDTSVAVVDAFRAIAPNTGSYFVSLSAYPRSGCADALGVTERGRRVRVEPRAGVLGQQLQEAARDQEQVRPAAPPRLLAVWCVAFAPSLVLILLLTNAHSWLARLGRFPVPVLP
jgi:hypothetical protein